jgi:hypothetical protein
MNQILSGALAMAFVVAGLFFLRFWRNTRDRLFGLFAVAFFVMSINRVLMGLTTSSGPAGVNLYWMRLVAFGLILAAILDKNRSQSRSKP